MRHTIKDIALTQKKRGIIMYANYHTHTKRCRHAAGEDREYVEAAIKQA